MKWLCVLALATTVQAETVAVLCPAQGPFRTIYAGVGTRDTEDLSTCGYDHDATVGDVGVQCQCPFSHLLAGCGAQLLVNDDGTMDGACLTQDWAGHRHVTWRGRVR